MCVCKTAHSMKQTEGTEGYERGGKRRKINDSGSDKRMVFSVKNAALKKVQYNSQLLT